MERPSIALAVIAKNEEENIRRWYASVEGLFDQYVFVDTGSTDKTVEIAKELGLEVHHFDWVDDFSAARNFSFSKVTKDYVAWIDLDDVLEGRENFIHFRNEVMKIADYWVAPYHYASHADGRPACTFIRERVMRTNKGLKWRYFVHEGVTPIGDNGPVNAQHVTGWWVTHKRTVEDLNKDRARNLNIFEKQMAKGSLDPRMQYYYGKELFENGKIAESIHALGGALASKDLEHHDRVLGTQYLLQAYIAENKLEQAVNLAQVGVLIDPNRAEYWCMYGDIYLKQGNPVAAHVFYEAAKSCMRAPAYVPSATFNNEDAYATYPMNQLARIYFHLGNIEKAKKEALEAYTVTKSKESHELLMEINRIDNLSLGYKNAPPCEDIVFTTGPQTAYEFNPEIAKTKAMGGSETALIEMAHWLNHISGRRVKVFTMVTKAATYNNVEYLSTNEIPNYMSKNRPYFHIAWRHNIKITDAPTFVWCHDLFTPGAENHQNYDKILCLTPFHKKYSMNVQNLPENKIWVTRNGIKPERFTDVGTYQKDPWKFIFSSSPDRGLDRTMRVLDKVRLKYPEVKLHVYYGIEHLSKWGRGDLEKELRTMMDERKDYVIYHGATQQDKLMEEFKTAAYCVQPSDWIETSMISAVERLCCGVYQIIRAVGGCVDTLASAARDGMCTLVDSECITESEYQKFVDATCEAIEQEAYKRVKVDPSQYDWKSVAQEWLDYLPTVRGDQDATARYNYPGHRVKRLGA